ncbi:MAG: GAP family protein [Acidimicrobiales bacterium]|jgi:threonine/homoserine/homoserine lactone efflux protein
MLLDLFVIGLVVTLEPIPLTAMILLLAAERGLMKGLGFTLGWLLTLVAIVALTVLVTGGKPLIPQSAPSTGALALKLAIGVGLLFVAYRRNRRPASTAPKKQPRWMSGIDRINPLAAAGLGFLLQPWVLVAAGVATITQANLSNGAEYFGVFAFCLWCTASYLVLEIYAAVRPEAVRTRLNALLQWINTHTDQAIVFLSLGLGLYLMAKSIYGLVSGG